MSETSVLPYRYSSLSLSPLLSRKEKKEWRITLQVFLSVWQQNFDWQFEFFRDVKLGPLLE